MNERTHFFRKIYLSHFIRKGCERVVCERWVRDWTDCNIVAPCSSNYNSTSFWFCWAAQPGGGSWGPNPSAGSWFSLPRTATRTPTNWFQLTRTVCGTELYNCLTSIFLWASHLHRIQPVHMSRLYLDIFDRMHLFLYWRLGRRSICYIAGSFFPIDAA